MFRSIVRLAMFIAFSTLIAACAAKPPSMEKLASTSDASHELEVTRTMLNEGRSQQLDMLAPKSFERAEASLVDAKNQLLKGKNKEKVLESIAEARGWLQEANHRADITRAAAKDIFVARQGALRAKAPALYEKEFSKLDERARDLAVSAEKGNLKKITAKDEELAGKYRDLEVRSVTKAVLGEAQINLETAKKEGAPRTAPKTFAATEAKIDNTLAMIKDNPANTEAIARAGQDATEESKFLLAVTQKTKQGNTEDLVLQTEKQRRVITGLGGAVLATELQLAQKNAALKTAAELRSQLKPNEAEVYVENNAVKVRLKGVQFGSNQATLNKKSTALLEKVDKALGTVSASKVTVEGYTDDVGNEQVNREISQKRAEAVQTFMASKGTIPGTNIQAVGRGEENPISDNKTPKGRAENRRIDLLIQPTIIQ